MNTNIHNNSDPFIAAIKSAVTPAVATIYTVRNSREKFLDIEKDIKDFDDAKQIEKKNIINIKSITEEDGKNAIAESSAISYVCKEYKKDISAYKELLSFSSDLLKTTTDFVNGLHKNLRQSNVFDPTQSANIKQVSDNAIVILNEHLREANTLQKEIDPFLSNISRYINSILESASYIESLKAFIPRMKKEVQDLNVSADIITLNIQNKFTTKVVEASKRFNEGDNSIGVNEISFSRSSSISSHSSRP